MSSYGSACPRVAAHILCGSACPRVAARVPCGSACPRVAVRVPCGSECPRVVACVPVWQHVSPISTVSRHEEPTILSSLLIITCFPYFILPFCFGFFLGPAVSLCSPGWPQTHDACATASRALGLQAYIPILSGLLKKRVFYFIHMYFLKNVVLQSVGILLSVSIYLWFPRPPVMCPCRS